jgi:hypothetical protein
MGSNAIGEGDRTNLVRYVSPTLAGFIASASWGEDDRVDASLRYAGEFSGIRVAAGIGYQKLTDANSGDGNNGCRNTANTTGSTAPQAVSSVNCEAIGLSASVMHMPTGLFVTGAYGQQKDKQVDGTTVGGIAVDGKGKGMYLQAGIEQKWFALGKTTVFGEYSKQTNGAQFGGTNTLSTFGGLPIIASEVKFYGIGLNQSIEAAAADFYIHYRAFTPSVTVVGTAAQVGALNAPQNFQAVMTGMVIRF